MLLIIIIILLLLIIKMIRPATDAKPDSTAAVSTESLAPETEAETVAAESTVYRTTDTVNVRPEPSTDTDRIGVLAPDTDVEYLRDYDEKWAVISYNGQEAYVSRDFIRQVSQKKNKKGTIHAVILLPDIHGSFSFSLYNGSSLSQLYFPQ